ncbi:MAG: nuclear transport factor 2 family protein [Gemmatimonadetes bacterium]|nr:nuclear transport factor 2 family protein [Gemmatimonadota bacterium]
MTRFRTASSLALMLAGVAACVHRGRTVAPLAIVPDSSVSHYATQAARVRPDSASVDASVRAFLVAFDSLQYAPFAAAWAPEATVFLPDADQPHLLSGRPAVLTYFRALFAEVRADSTRGVPTLQILPAVRELRIRLTGPEGALVTFELTDGTAPGRRTLVWAWDQNVGAWQLLHLHASRLTPE